MHENLKKILEVVQDSSISDEVRSIITNACASLRDELDFTRSHLDSAKGKEHTHAILLEEVMAELEEKRRALVEVRAELTDVYERLKAGQIRLLQTEKMATLGELTAGITHEIQNPLNFITNFAEVNGELCEELLIELEKGNAEEAKNLATDFKVNSEKILYHSQRAATIVKSMLQHSRTNIGQKELTDINSLCDEYMRLAYHGMRARDKSFNVNLESSFDDTLLPIMVVPQDIGRVLLNLITNAFYAVTEKRSHMQRNYLPKVSIVTKNQNDSLKIQLVDNGSGISEEISEKIFQPFFTTKPAGEGTGLGLSLSYDIIKSHGGDILVESHENIGTSFTVILPHKTID